ncbi:hypothetical protein [Microbispora triticiradicis]|uniref:hypothetical protein n=1 Tax=Microbispora triticiradicis TaxID=2200763 RepID=UPI001AD7E2D8|nr:hypothetical protein [Microbispora triticiradicis]MBO4273966.1 hypothetical protein [Microbispora triticiradicis]
MISQDGGRGDQYGDKQGGHRVHFDGDNPLNPLCRVERLERQLIAVALVVESHPMTVDVHADRFTLRGQEVSPLAIPTQDRPVVDADLGEQQRTAAVAQPIVCCCQ